MCDERKPDLGPGQTAICQRCVEQKKQDVANRIVFKLSKMSLPSSVVNGVDEWAEIRDDLKIWRGQHGG